MSNLLTTLLEAAQFIEREEHKQKQAALDAALNNPTTTAVITTTSSAPNHPHPVIHRPPIVNMPPPLNQQTLVIATSHLPGAAQSVIHTSVPLTSSSSAMEVSSMEKKVDTQNRARIINNSFDIRNTMYVDEKNNVAKRKPPPLVFRSGTREVHNKLEKHRRAHLKECFDYLKKQLPPTPDEKKTSNLNILHSAIRYIDSLKKTEKDHDQEMERLARQKIGLQTRLAMLKKDLSSRHENIDFNRILSNVVPATPEDNLREIENEENLVEMRDEDSRTEMMEEMPQHHVLSNNGVKKLSLPILPSKGQGPVASTVSSLKEVQQPVQTALSVLPVGYPINQGLVLQKLAIVPKGITDLTPLVPTFITQQQLNAKVVPLVNAQYVVGKCPLVVVSTASPRPS